MTFTIHNLQTGKLTSFTNRDQFLFEMEQIENRHLATNTTGHYSIAHTDKAGQALEELDLEIPPTEGNLQAILQGFGHTAESGGMFSRRKPKKTLEVPIKVSESQPVEQRPEPESAKAQIGPSKTSSDQEEGIPARSTAVNQVFTPRNAIQAKLKNIVLVAGFALVLGLAFYGAVMSHAVATGLKDGTIQTTSKPVTIDNTNEHEVDVFSRYFLGAYFSDSDLENYVSSKVDKEAFDKVTTSAVLLEKAKAKGKGAYEMTYVVSYVKDDQVTSSRFTFTVTPNKKAMYGYEVTKVPKQSNYPD